MEAERKKYFNNLGYLYPGRNDELTKADTFDKLKDAVRSFEYEKIMNQVHDVSQGSQANEFSSNSKSIGKLF